MVQMETSAYWHRPIMDIYLLRNVQLSPEIKVSRGDSIFLFVTVARRGDWNIPGLGCTAPCRGSRPPPAGPGSPLTTQTPCVFINIFTWLDWIYLENLLLIITLLKMFFFYPLCLFYLFYTYKNLYNNIVKNVFLLPSFTYSILIGDQQINRGWL